MIRIASTILILILCTCQAYCDWKVIILTKTEEGQSFESTFYIKDGMLRQSTPEMDVIINPKGNQIFYINNMNKMYWVGSKEDFENELEELMKMMMIETMGEEAYEEYKQSMDSEEEDPPDKNILDIEILVENETVEVAGYKGAKHIVKVDGMMVEEIWLCKEISAFNDFDFEEMGKMFGEEDNGDYSSTSEYNDMIKTKGFPIKEMTYSFGELVETVELISAEEATLSPELFEAPSGYSTGGLVQVMGMQ